jgi:hypothetical protein
VTSSEIQLDILITDKDADAERIDTLTVRLMRDLRELGVESVERSPGEDVPEGAKGDAFTVGALALVAVPAILPSLVNFMQAWSLRGGSRKVKIKTPAGLELEFTPDKRMSQREVLALVEQLTVSADGAGEAVEARPATLNSRTQLRQLLSKHFDEGELQTLCFDLGVDYDSLPGDGKGDKVRALIAYLERRGRVQELVALGKRLRPDVPWESLLDAN